MSVNINNLCDGSCCSAKNSQSKVKLQSPASATL